MLFAVSDVHAKDPEGLQWLTLILLQDFVRRKHKNIPIEVETRTLDEVKEVLQFLGTDKHSLVKRLMLDNMTKLDPSAPGICLLCMLVLMLRCQCTRLWCRSLQAYCLPFSRVASAQSIRQHSC